MESNNIKPTSVQQTPAELVSNILKHLPPETLHDATIITDMFPNVSTDDVHKDLRIRQDPVRYFKQLTPKAEELLAMMLLTETILVGPRAVEYFVPGLDDTNSTWIFVCHSVRLIVGRFLDFMLHLGLELEHTVIEGHKVSPVDIHAAPKVSMLTCHLVNGNVRHEVQLVNASFSTNIDAVLSYRFTHNQCFIAGYGAVSLQSYLTRLYKTTQTNHTHPYLVDCTSSGFDIIDCYETTRIAKRNLEEPFVTRTLGDTYCYVVPYTDLTCYSERLRSLADTLLNNIRQYQWREYQNDESKSIPSYNFDNRISGIDMTGNLIRPLFNYIRDKSYITADQLLPNTVFDYVDEMDLYYVGDRTYPDGNYSVRDRDYIRQWLDKEYIIDPRNYREFANILV